MEETQLATAKEFNIPLYYVQINEICYENNLEWYYSYYENEEKVKMTKQRRLWLRFLLFISKRRRVLTLPSTKVQGFSGYAQTNVSHYRLKVLPEPIKKFLCFSGLDFTQKPDFRNHQSKLLKNFGRQTLSLFHFFRLTPTHILRSIAYFRKEVKPDSSPALKCGVFSGTIINYLRYNGLTARQLRG